jgi:hypothetical protein
MKSTGGLCCLVPVASAASGCGTLAMMPHGTMPHTLHSRGPHCIVRASMTLTDCTDISGLTLVLRLVVCLRYAGEYGGSGWTLVVRTSRPGGNCQALSSCCSCSRSSSSVWGGWLASVKSSSSSRSAVVVRASADYNLADCSHCCCSSSRGQMPWWVPMRQVVGTRPGMLVLACHMFCAGVDHSATGTCTQQCAVTQLRRGWRLLLSTCVLQHKRRITLVLCQ